MTLDPFYLIVDTADWIERLVPCGVKLVQLRMKNVEPSTVRAHVRRARQICARHDCQLIINDFWQTAIEEGGDFIHLGQEDLAAADIHAIRTANLRIGISTHNEAELETALAVSPDYVALGPIYPTTLKQMNWQPQGPEKLGRWKARIGNLPLVAIGGLRVDRLEGVFASGADSAAVVSDITRHRDPEGQTRRWIEQTSAIRHRPGQVPD
ncbi:thiamine phosphate synthase [Rhizobium sp. SL42]|uniref:thiamine phosphate synthase n=1 Tax=Rhizobium sp. SL42 TaxID=2806346 RepID=UPI001F01CF2C|nr:thiamine phosphate synthase [Rhizobium sp. SL42]UJW74953.1 thiamine phosphate synthase [Rhizobium sp. SL42]